MPDPNPAPLTVAQQNLWRVVAAQPHPVTISALRELTGRHPNSLRDLLAPLVAGGYVTRAAVVSPRRGRRAWAYAATGDSAPPGGRLAELAAALTAVLADAPGADDRAYAVGHAWGGEMRTGTFARTGVTVADVTDLLTQLGYAPTLVAERKLELQACPLSVAGAPHPLVCQLHRGLLDALAGCRDNFLRPHVRDGVCEVELSARVAA